MTEYHVEENEVLQMLETVAGAKREAKMQLNDSDFGSRKRIQREKGTLSKKVSHRRQS